MVFNGALFLPLGAGAGSVNCRAPALLYLRA